MGGWGSYSGNIIRGDRVRGGNLDTDTRIRCFSKQHIEIRECEQLIGCCCCVTIICCLVEFCADS